MADKPCEFQLYRARFGLSGRKMMYDVHLAVEGSKDGSMDDATELATEVCDEINAETGEDYALQFLGSIGTVWIWCKA